MRGIRKAIRRHFEQCGFGRGKHHWSEARWLIEAEDYLTQCVKIKKPSEHEVAATVLLLYHSFGPSKEKPVDPESVIYQRLGDDGMDLYKCIFDNNNKEQV